MGRIAGLARLLMHSQNETKHRVSVQSHSRHPAREWFRLFESSMESPAEYGLRQLGSTAADASPAALQSCLCNEQQAHPLHSGAGLANWRSVSEDMLCTHGGIL